MATPNSTESSVSSVRITHLVERNQKPLYVSIVRKHGFHLALHIGVVFSSQGVLHFADEAGRLVHKKGGPRLRTEKTGIFRIVSRNDTQCDGVSLLPCKESFA